MIMRRSQNPTETQVYFAHSVAGLACFLRVPDLVARCSKEDRGGDWQLPESPAVHA